MFGMKLHQQQLNMLINMGVTKYNICLDRQYEVIYNSDGSYTQEFEQYKKIVDNMVQQIQPYGEVSVIYDTERLLDYKDSPSDKGKDVFVELYKQRERFT
jgi:hypothetical protein